MKIKKRRIIIRGLSGELPKRKAKKTNTIKIIKNPENEKKRNNSTLVNVFEDVVPLGELGKYLNLQNRKRTKLETKMATNLIARLMVLGLKRDDIADMLGFESTSAIDRLTKTVEFNNSLLEAKESVFGDLDDKLKLIYVRAITRLQDIVSSKNDFVALKACDLVMRQMALMENKLVGSTIINNNTGTKMDSKTRQAALDYLKASQNSKRKIVVRKK